MLYDDVLDLISIAGHSDQFQVISYGAPILPSTITLILNEKKDMIELKDQDVLLVRLYRVNAAAGDL